MTVPGKKGPGGEINDNRTNYAGYSGRGPGRGRSLVCTGK